MTDVKVNSRICGFVHRISGKLDGKNIIIDIDTPCKKVALLSHMEIPIKELYEPFYNDNQIFDKIKEAKWCSTCLVPCGIMHVCRMDIGTISKTLAKSSGSISIEFE
ncbi:MAG: hypothetical protein H5T43_01220 [Methanomethylovorans sp.]|nr:hypothetical protein [Methanomethylovorans sp.]